MFYNEKKALRSMKGWLFKRGLMGWSLVFHGLEI
jgi:hypothetical protein